MLLTMDKKILSRQDAKTAKKIFLLRIWRALPFDLAQGGEFSLRESQDRESIRTVEPRLRARHSFSDLFFIQNFKYLWLVFCGHSIFIWWPWIDADVKRDNKQRGRPSHECLVDGTD